MKNFPHQSNQIDKLKDALQVASNLIDKNKDIGDDTVFGIELVKNGIKNLRKGDTIRQQLKIEASKQPSERPSETAAREYRRFFALLGFLSIHKRTEEFKITKIGKKILNNNNPRILNKLWHDSLVKMELPDTRNIENISTPYKILIKLIIANPGIEREKLCLAFESNDNSDEEFERIQNLIDLEYNELLKELNVSKYTARNVTLVLPTLGSQIGDFIRKNGRYYPTQQLLDMYEEECLKSDGVSEVIRNRVTRVVSSANIAELPKSHIKDDDEILADLTESRKKIAERRIKHNKLVREFARLLEACGYKFKEFPYDCFATKDTTKLLIEAKTIESDFGDQRRQSEKAIGQIRGYREFSLSEIEKEGVVDLIILFDKRPKDCILNFVSSNIMYPIWLENDEFYIQNYHHEILEFNEDSIPEFFLEELIPF